MLGRNGTKASAFERRRSAIEGKKSGLAHAHALSSPNTPLCCQPVTASFSDRVNLSASRLEAEQEVEEVVDIHGLVGRLRLGGIVVEVRA